MVHSVHQQWSGYTSLPQHPKTQEYNFQLPPIYQHAMYHQPLPPPPASSHNDNNSAKPVGNITTACIQIHLANLWRINSGSGLAKEAYRLREKSEFNHRNITNQSKRLDSCTVNLYPRRPSGKRFPSHGRIRAQGKHQW